jgi:ribonuclease-3
MHELLQLKNEKLLYQALTHRSYINENPEAGEHNERLEFLGDALLNYLSGQYLFNRYPEKGEDELTRRRSALVDEKQLAKFAIEVGLNLQMRLGKGAIAEGGYQNENLLSSTFEAVVAAYYLDNNSDILALKMVIEPLFDGVPEDVVMSRSQIDSKNRFQEWIQRNITTTPPKYVSVQVGGTSHAPEFVATVLVESKKDAEKAAAEDAWNKLKIEGIIK